MNFRQKLLGFYLFPMVLWVAVPLVFLTRLLAWPASFWAFCGVVHCFGGWLMGRVLSARWDSISRLGGMSWKETTSSGLLAGALGGFVAGLLLGLPEGLGTSLALAVAESIIFGLVGLIAGPVILSWAAKNPKQRNKTIDQ